MSAVTAESAYGITGQGYAPGGEVLEDGKPAGEDPVLKLMGRVSMLCNDAELLQQEGTWKVEGDPTEGALYPFAAKIGLRTARSNRRRFRGSDAIPFESEHTLHGHAARRRQRRADAAGRRARRK